MLGQAQTPRRRLLGVALVALTVLAVPAVGGADPSTSAHALRQENADLAAKSRAAVLSLYSLDSQLETARTRLAHLQARAQELRRERASLARQLRVARAGVRISQRHLASRLRLLYEQGDVSAIEVLLGAKSLDDALTGLDNLDRVASQDEEVLRQLHTAKRRLGTASTTLAGRARALETATRSAAATAASLERTRSERTAYIAQIAQERQLNATQISRLEAQARAATARSEQLASAPPAAPAPDLASAAVAPAAAATPAVAPGAGGGTITVTATGYALSGTTATGLPVGWGIAAVDPRVIPLGTHMTIPGYGEAVAADTGGAVVGATVDLWFPSVAEAQAWGRRTVTISLH